MEMNKMHDDVYNSNEKSKTLEIIGNIIKTESNNNTADFTIDALEAIHNTWVSDNENKFFKEGRNAEFQHMPIELIGWDEAKKDLLFLNPILQKMGISNSEQELEESYEEKQKRFNQIHDITNKETLLEEISKGKEFYNVLQPEISEELKNPMTTQKIVNQITQKNPTLLKNVPNRINSL